MGDGDLSAYGGRTRHDQGSPNTGASINWGSQGCIWFRAWGSSPQKDYSNVKEDGNANVKEVPNHGLSSA